MKTRTVIYAEEGHILTDGKTYGRQIFLGEGMSEADFHEITESEYEAILAEQELAEQEKEML